MQFTMMMCSGRNPIPQEDVEVVADINGVVREKRGNIPRSSFLWSSLRGIPGNRVLVTLTGGLTTPAGIIRTVEIRVPVVFRKSMMVLVGTDGRRELDAPVAEALRSALGTELGPVIPSADSILELLKCTKRIESGYIHTEDGTKELGALYESLAEGVRETSSVWSMLLGILAASTLLSANLVFSAHHKELYMRYFLDSFWVPDREEPEDIDFLITRLERFLVEGAVCSIGPEGST